MSEETRPRDFAEAVMDVRYGVRFNEMNERFYRRLDMTLTALSLIGGTAAVGSLLAPAPGLAALASIAVAGAAVCQAVLRPQASAVRHNEYRRRFADLDVRAPGLDLPALDAELRRLQGEAPAGLSGLALPAFARNLRSHGLDASAVEAEFGRWGRALNAVV